MELNEQRYWQALRELLDRAVADEAADLADAERMLAETAPEPGSHFSDERIAEVVRLVTAADTAVALANAPDDVFDDVLRSAPTERSAEAWQPVPPPAPVRVEAAPVLSINSARPTLRQRLQKLPRPLAAAAMILLAPQFLAAMGVVGVVIVASQMLTFTTYTVGFQSAVEGMHDSETDEASRLSHLSVVVSHLGDSIAAMRDVAASDSPLAVASRKALDDARTQSAAFTLRTFTESHVTLRERFEDKGQDVLARTEALRGLTEQLSYGLAAVRTVQALPGVSAHFSLSAATYLADLTRQLEQ